MRVTSCRLAFAVNLDDGLTKPFLSQVCKYTFSFKPVYAADVPSSLPLSEFLAEVGQRINRGAQLCMRLIVVISIWMVVPLLTCWLWQLCFVRHLSQV